MAIGVKGDGVGVGSKLVHEATTAAAATNANFHRFELMRVNTATREATEAIVTLTQQGLHPGCVHDQGQ
jgi:hypothetical protein